ncbi:MAG: hypothetical protein AAGF74_01480 [Pseudomonadota bacterium]
MSSANPTMPAAGIAASQTDAETKRPKPKPYRGPVMMADILISPGGRPGLLSHWDRTGEDQDE